MLEKNKKLKGQNTKEMVLNKQANAKKPQFREHGIGHNRNRNRAGNYATLSVSICKLDL
jgi:hypothetical protein